MGSADNRGKTLFARLFEKIVVLPNGCWRWIGATGKRQRGGKTGRLWGGKGSRTRYVQPTRQMLAFATGKNPSDKDACHQCPFNDELCCNPLHLYWGSQSANELDKHDTDDDFNDRF